MIREFRIMKRLYAVITAVVLFAAACFYFYSVRPVKVYGHTFTLDEKTLSFDDGEIADLDELTSDLKQFRSLKRVDLGSYLVHADDADELDGALPGVELDYETYIIVYKDAVLTSSETLDLSSKTISDVAELRAALPYLNQLKSVKFGENTLPRDVKSELCAEYPDVEFDVITTYNVYGVSVREDDTLLDLTGASIDGDLAKHLHEVPNITEVDLRGIPLTIDEQKALIAEFPDMKFFWEIELDGNYYDSAIETLDLTGCWWIGTDAVRERLPLFTDLKYLDMSDCGATNEEMAQLRDEFPDTKIVWKLYLGTRWSLKTDAVAFSVLIYDYSHKRMTSADIEVLKYCTDLQALDIGHQAVTDISVIGEYLTELRILILADNAISDLSPLANLKHLHYLEFFVNQISDLSPLAELHEMVDLNISYNYRINDITPLLNMPLIEKLWLESTSVSEADVQLLRYTYPNAHIVNHGSGSVDQGWRWNDRYFAMIDMYHNNYMSELFSMYDGLTEPPVIEEADSDTND